MKQYKVTGDRETLGYAPGETFSADIPEAQEKRLVKRGAIEVSGGADESTSDSTVAPDQPVVSGEPELPVEPGKPESGSGTRRGLSGRKE